ncbi:hypothetical protein AU210_011512 [Fusarium oxysporum f. sp. radicis-cucumerinum]|uniref:Uncharacterized protein n=1 Tax=Fusarium oxysporum f. sp. radicis-cucumerinum TaxID=327505 RepID=A0A2H3GDV1_FUSOX|nr:hypothetical protein AU210_011512 [Fusarium oxysporum f. sp. radicis-cucumerinum]RKL07004.1 hypothetical protein BFJ71_g2324 [Fusarium oxysporum]
MANSADRVFHTLELAQQIVFELELKDFFRALSITKRLWESQVPNHVWEEHLMRLGYPLQAIRQTSHSLKTCYTRISQAADAISHGASPRSNLIRLKNELGGNYTYEYHYDGDMAAPLIIQSSSPDKAGDKCNIFAIDLEDPRLLFTDVENFPKDVVLSGTALLGIDYSVDDIDSPPVVLYSLDDWSLITKFTNTHLGNGEMIIWFRDYQLYKNFILISYIMFNQTEGVIQTWFDIWDVQGTKRGEIIVAKQGFADDPFHSNADSHYLTILSNPWFEDGQQTIQTWDLERMELTYECTISQADMDEDHSCHTKNGIVYICDGSGRISEYWAVDGRPISRKMADMEWNSDRSRKFSDGSRIVWAKWLTLYTNEGDVVQRFKVKQGKGYCLEAGILFDRFIFSISWREKSKHATLMVYSKTGKKLTSSRVAVRGRCLRWFIDIAGRLVLIWDTCTCMEIVDFRGLLQRRRDSQRYAYVESYEN